jgi:hypothetical protein
VTVREGAKEIVLTKAMDLDMSKLRVNNCVRVNLEDSVNFPERDISLEKSIKSEREKIRVRDKSELLANECDRENKREIDKTFVKSIDEVGEKTLEALPICSVLENVKVCEKLLVPRNKLDLVRRLEDPKVYELQRVLDWVITVV